MYMNAFYLFDKLRPVSESEEISFLQPTSVYV